MSEGMMAEVMSGRLSEGLKAVEMDAAGIETGRVVISARLGEQRVKYMDLGLLRLLELPENSLLQ